MLDNCNFLHKNYIIPTARRIGADIFEFGCVGYVGYPEIADVMGGKKNIKSAAKDVGRKQLGGSSRKCSASRVFPTISTKRSSPSGKEFFDNVAI